MSTDRRVFLVNKLVDVGLQADEQLELDALQKEEGKRRMAANRQEETKPNTVWVVTMGRKFPKCIQGIFPSKKEAEDAMKLGAHKFLRGPFEMDFGSTATIAAPLKPRKEWLYYHAINLNDANDTRSFTLPNVYPRHMDPLGHTGSHSLTNYAVATSLEGHEDAKRKAHVSWQAVSDERRRKAKNEEMAETWREVTRWEEIDRIQATLEKLKKEAKAASLEDATEIYNRKFPS